MLAATPAPRAKKALRSLAASSRGRPGDVRKLIFEVKEAFLRAPGTGDKYAQPPEEDADDGMCGKLNASPYGARGAAPHRGRKYVAALKELGFLVGREARPREPELV